MERQGELRLIFGCIIPPPVQQRGHLAPWRKLTDLLLSALQDQQTLSRSKLVNMGLTVIPKLT